MRNSFFTSFILIALSALIFTGCNVEHNKDVAAEKAREYVLEKIPRMSPQNAAYIKYTYPKLVTAPIYSTDKASEKDMYWNWGAYSDEDPTNFSSSREFSQVAFTWDLPNPKVSVMVLGTCYDNYQGWYPIKLILRPTALVVETDTAKAKDKPDIIKMPTSGLSAME